MFPTFENTFENARGCIDATVYCIDHQFLTGILVRKAHEGLDIRMLMDQKNFNCSSCIRQAPVQKALFDAGVVMKTYRPAGQGWPCLHAKNFIIDHRVLLTGSVNLTQNGLEKNIETLLWITDPAVLGSASADFEKWWKLAKPVTHVEIDQAVDTWKARKPAVPDQVRCEA